MRAVVASARTDALRCMNERVSKLSNRRMHMKTLIIAALFAVVGASTIPVQAAPQRRPFPVDPFSVYAWHCNVSGDYEDAVGGERTSDTILQRWDVALMLCNGYTNTMAVDICAQVGWTDPANPFRLEYLLMMNPHDTDSRAISTLVKFYRNNQHYYCFDSWAYVAGTGPAF